MAKKKAKVVPEVMEYSVTLTVNGGDISVSGATLTEALSNLPAFTPKTTGSLVVSKSGKNSKPIPLNINAIKRIQAPGLTGDINRTILAKRYEFFA